MYSIADEILSKYASSKKDLDNWEKSLDPQVKRERDLIRDAQNGNFLAMKSLQNEFRGTITQCVNMSGLTGIMDHGSAYQEALKLFRQAVNSFDLTQDVKPNTYITSMISLGLKNVRYQNRDTLARKSQDLTMHAETVATAKSFLKNELGRDPNVDETFSFIKNNLRTSKSITKDNIKKINAYERKELSADRIIGGDAAGDAEELTFGDIMNTSSLTPEQVMKMNLQEQLVESKLKLLSRPERKLIRSFYGLGEYKNNKAKSLRAAAINSAMTYYQAKKIIDDFYEKLKSEGVL